VEQQRTKKTFDVEWNVFSYDEKIYGHSANEELKDFFVRMTVDESFLRGKTVLDAGCGIGRLTQSVGSFAREIVGIDFSSGVDEAWLLNEEKHNIHILQGDLMNLPFKGSSFDYVYSKGVLHYVSDVKMCVGSLASVVGPGGALSVTLYPKMSPFFELFNHLLRSATVRLPIRIVYCISYLLIPFMSFAWKWSGLERRDIHWNERAHMIFNWLSSEFQNRVSNEEIEGCFKDLGFNNIRLSDRPVGITGFKPDSMPREES
jgi:ubiquinone/menaquinone biosynthesis C-methylase UbiE